MAGEMIFKVPYLNHPGILGFCEEEKGKTLRTHRENLVNRSIHSVTPPVWSQGQQHSQELLGEGVSHHCDGSVPLCQDSTSALHSDHPSTGAGPRGEPTPPLCPAALGRGWLTFPMLDIPTSLSSDISWADGSKDQVRKRRMSAFTAG